MVEIHHVVCAPQWKWLWTKPIAGSIVFIVAVFGYATLFLGFDGIKNFALEHQQLYRLFMFGSPDSFAHAVQRFFVIVAVIHVLEASFVAYHAIRTIKLSWKSSFSWFALITLAGFPVTNEFMRMLAVHKMSKLVKTA